jgi:hypothetical protein
MSDSGTFVYLLEEDAVLAMLPGWPAGMQVAVCLSDGGACDLAVHHRNEVARVLERIQALHDMTPDDLCVAPEVEGYPTRKVLFSEEQQLLSLVADSPNLAELASDYALNYRFAQDEGLDAEMITGPAVARQPQTAPDKPAKAPATPRKTKSGAKAGTVAAKTTGIGPDTAATRATAFVTHLSLPSGYAAPAPAQRPECVFVDAHLTRVHDRIRLVIAPEQANGKEQPVAVTRIGCRDDFARFVLPRASLEGWAEGRAALLDLPEDLLPEAVVARFTAQPHLCQVTVTVRGVFVAPVGPLAATPPANETRTPLPAPRAKRRFLGTVHMAVAALVGVMLVTGHFAAALDRAPVQSAAVYGAGGDANANAALDLVAAMARGDTTY